MKKKQHQCKILLPLFQEGQLSVTGESMCMTYWYCLGGLSLPRKSVDRLTDHPDTTLDVYRGLKTTIQQQQLRIHYSDGKFEDRPDNWLR